MLEHALHDIVAVLVHRQALDIPEDFVDQIGHLLLRALLQQALDDPATIHVSRHALSAVCKSLRYEVDGVTRHVLYHRLDHMVAMHVLDALQDLPLELGGNGHLRFRREKFEHLLNHTAAILVRGKIEHLTLHLVRESLPLVGSAALEQFLHHEVPEYVAGKVSNIWQGDGKDAVFLLVLPDIVKKSPLQEAASFLLHRRVGHFGQHLVQFLAGLTR
mmetsp:Transcript_14138/g.40690  ORF Transcript_14138/g.40690 Transcript_14138/m.40690 type:complete len:217 (-) Transcript_14138:104-754(-)